MTDPFALLNEPRRPWLDEAALKARFLELSARWHPDRFHTAPDPEREEAHHRFAELNAAHQDLREVKTRLLRLLELESGSRPRNIQRIPPGTMDLFVEVGQACRDADAFLSQRAQVTSPLLKVQMFQKGMEWTERLNELQRKVNVRRDELCQELERMNPVWASAPPVGAPGRAPALPLDRLEQIYRALSYVTRWTEQLRERLVQLAV